MALVSRIYKTAAEWAAQNPVLERGTLGFDTTNFEYRVGDGTSTWSALTPNAGASFTNGSTWGPGAGSSQAASEVLVDTTGWTDPAIQNPMSAQDLFTGFDAIVNGQLVPAINGLTPQVQAQGQAIEAITPLAPGPLANRPSASSVQVGVAYVATDSEDPVSYSTGTDWWTPPSATPFFDLATDTATTSTTISALNVNYQLGGLITQAKTWPGGLVRVSCFGVMEKLSGHVLGATDVVALQYTVDGGTTWLSGIVPAIGWRQVGNGWIPDQPLIGLTGAVAQGATVQFRVAMVRLFTGTAPVTVQWTTDAKSLLVECLR